MHITLKSELFCSISTTPPSRNMNVQITAQDVSDADDKLEIKNTVTPPTPSSDESTTASSSSPKLDAVSALLKAAEIPTINPVATSSQQHLVETHPHVVKKRGRGRPRKDGMPARSRKDEDMVAEMLLLLRGQDQKQPAAKKFKAACNCVTGDDASNEKAQAEHHHVSAVADPTVTKWDDKWLQHFRVLQVSVL